MSYFDPDHFPPPQEDRTQPPANRAHGRLVMFAALAMLVIWIVFGVIGLFAPRIGGAR